MEKEDIINPLEEVVDVEDEKTIFMEMLKIDGLHKYLRALLARDMQFYFNAQKEEQDLIRGAYHRTLWFMKKLKQYSEKSDSLTKK